MMPKVSVIMTVYNCEKYLAQAIESIITQTFTDFEFIIISEYGSNQETQQIISNYAQKDDRIIVINNTSRLGIAASLNIGMRCAKGEYLARMDGDDISLPKRLAVQVEYMDHNKETSICGCRVLYIDGNGKELYYKDNLSADPKQIKADLLFFCFIHHPSVIFRKSAVIEHGLYYDETYNSSEDHELWIRASQVVKIAVVPDVLLKYRWHMGSAFHTGGDQQQDNCLWIMRGNMENLQIPVSDDELSYLQRTTCRESFRNHRKIEKTLNSFYTSILSKNNELMIYDEDSLRRTLAKRMYWKRHKIRRWAVVFLKSMANALSKERLFYVAIYLELNGFSAALKRAFR